MKALRHEKLRLRHTLLIVSVVFAMAVAACGSGRRWGDRHNNPGGPDDGSHPGGPDDHDGSHGDGSRAF